MKLTELKFRLDFERPVLADVFPAFALRSVLGLYLKRMHCVVHSATCEDCPFVHTCSYAFLFESILPKENAVIPGRNRASHPFRIETLVRPGELVSTLDFTFQLYGKGIEYVPHVIYAFRIAGEKGLFRSRMPFKTHVFNSKDLPLDHGDKIIMNRVGISNLALAPNNLAFRRNKYHVVCNTPVRFKTRGKYSANFSARDFLEACKRRIETLLCLYGTEDECANLEFSSQDFNIEISENSLHWYDLTRYSSRQESLMKLGGVIGSFEISGEAPEYLWKILEIASIVGVGKNTSFGLGSIDVREVSHAERI